MTARPTPGTGGSGARGLHPNPFGGSLNGAERLAKAMRPFKDVRRTPEDPPPSPFSAATRAPLTGDEKLDDLVAAHPETRLPLLSYGLCACCSGRLTLRQGAEIRGLALPALLEDLNRELAKGA